VAVALLVATETHLLVKSVETVVVPLSEATHHAPVAVVAVNGKTATPADPVVVVAVTQVTATITITEVVV
jgi:hypothetical protein